MWLPDLDAARADGRLKFIDRHAGDLVRITRFPATEPYFGRAKRNRFDDPSMEYGVLYAGDCLDVAFAETLLHEDSAHVDGEWVVDQEEVEARFVVSLGREHPLKLADLTGQALKALGLDNRLSADTSYDFTWDLSRALHQAAPECDGILYVSRHVNTRLAVALFDRSAVRISPDVVPLRNHRDFEAALSAFRVVLACGE